jgi:hypothetical protein
MPTKGIKPAKPVLTGTQFQGLFSEPLGAARTGDWEDAQSGTLPNLVEQTRTAAEQPLQAAIADDQLSVGDLASAAVQSTDTAYLYNSWVDSAEAQLFQFDPTYKPEAHYRNLVQQYQLPEDERTFNALAAAGSGQEAAALATQLQKQRNAEDILTNHGAIALTAGILDPVWLVGMWASGGVGAFARLGRLGNASLQGATGLAVTAAADAAGADKTILDYTINTALGAGFGALMGVAKDPVAQAVQNGVQTMAPQGGMAQGLTDILSETDRLISASPESAALLSNLVDDPVRRAGVLSNDNAASYLRRFSNEVDGDLANWQRSLDDVVASDYGLGAFTRHADLGGKYTAARLELEDRVATELARRDFEFHTYGGVPPSKDQLAGRLADEYEGIMTRGAERAKASGVPGFEDFAATPGYFHRAWNPSKVRKVSNDYGRDFVKAMFVQSARNGLGMTAADAGVLATAFLTRIESKDRGLRADFMGALGRNDTDAIREMLAQSGATDSAQKSVMKRIEQNLDEAGKVKYSKSRVPLDMTVTAIAPDGRTVRMLDLIDTDLSRLAENYGQSLAGRSALAKAGYGGDDAGLNRLRAEYEATLRKSNLTETDHNTRLEQLDHLLGDFTGIRPASAQLGNLASRAKALTQATMLAASGLWQAAEYATMSYRYGAVNTTKEFLRQFPGIAGTLRKIGRDPDLYEELQTVVGLDLARDVRIRPWLRQHEAYADQTDSMVDRVLHYGQQAVPILNGMKFVHQHQTRMNTNLALNTLAKAAHGDKAAVKMLGEYGLTGQAWKNVQAAIVNNTEMAGKNARKMNMDAWDDDAVDAALNVATRIMDDTVLFGRAGQGSSFSRSAVGQILGQFRSFVSFAHNKLLRGTVENAGYTGAAVLFAYQMPLTMMMVGVNEVRKGESVALDDAGLAALAQKALGYNSVLGFVGDLAGIAGLTGGRGGLSVPVTGLANAVPAAAGAIGNTLTGDFQGAAADSMQVARTALPFLNVAPGMAALNEALKEE